MKRVGEILQVLSFVVALSTAILALLAFWIAYQQFEEEREARAWMLLSNKTTGSAGKAPAMEFLSDREIDLSAIDLSCTAMGGGWNAQNLTCQRPVVLSQLDLRTREITRCERQLDYFCLKRLAEENEVALNSASFAGAHMDGANLTASKITGADFSGASLWTTKLDFASARMAKFVNAKLISASVKNADLSHSNLVLADLTDSDLAGSDLTNANISAVYWCDKWKSLCARNLTPKQIESAWAFDLFWFPNGLPDYLLATDGSTPQPKLCPFDNKIHGQPQDHIFPPEDCEHRVPPPSQSETEEIIRRKGGAN
ncbi:MAG: pentapeptide repeat-containing protein [Pseudomonadota bacterium]